MNATDAKIKRWKTDFQQFAKDCLIVRDHNTSSLLPFRFNSPQKILHTIVEKQKYEKGRVRVAFLKSRRFGGSTYVEGRFYWRTALSFNKNTFIIGHENESTTTLFRMALLFQEKNPIAPSTIASNAQELRFDRADGNGLKSEYRLATAKNVDAGRSQGIHYLHASEEAFWPGHAQELLNGLFACVPKPPAESEIFRESTANGFGNTFQTTVFNVYAEGSNPYYTMELNLLPHMKESKAKFTFAYQQEDSDWILVFVPWFCIETYQMRFDTHEQKEKFIKKAEQKVFDHDQMQWVDSEETKLRNKYGLSWEQLLWRRWTFENDCNKDLDLFHKEYPSSIEEAFIGTGTNTYSKDLCDEIEANTHQPLLVGELVDRAGKSKVKPNRSGKFKLWEKPEKTETYFMTVDPGGGIKQSQKDAGKEPDPTCIDVWNRRTGVQCAQWHGNIEYGMIADIVYLVGRMYNMCTACIELMNHGYTVVDSLNQDRYPMYEAKPGEPGWLTTRASKPRMVDSLGVMAKDGDLQIRCKETVSEMRTFIEENGKYHGSSGSHDDRVMSAAMASQMMVLLPKKFRDAQRRIEGFTNISGRYDRTPDYGYQEVMVN